jgi:hypothetical protein
VAIYQFWSRWLTPMFQSNLDTVATLRDWVLHPASRLPGGRGQMLRGLTGTRIGWWRALALPEAFVEALDAARRGGGKGVPADPVVAAQA